MPTTNAASEKSCLKPYLRSGYLQYHEASKVKPHNVVAHIWRHTLDSLDPNVVAIMNMFKIVNTDQVHLGSLMYFISMVHT